MTRRTFTPARGRLAWAPWVLALFILAAVLSPAAADDETIAEEGSTVTGPTGLFTIQTAEGLRQGSFNIGFWSDSYDREPGGLDLKTFALSFGIGLIDNLELSLQLPYTQIEADGTPSAPALWGSFFATGHRTERGFGDVRLGLRYTFLDQRRGAPLSLGLGLEAKAPTANEDKGLGTGELDVGALLFLSKQIGSIGLHINAGYLQTGDPTGFDVANELRYGLGLVVPATSRLRGVLELTGTNYSGGDANPDDAFDVTAGLIYRFGGASVGGGARNNVQVSDGGDDDAWGGVTVIGYHHERNRPPVVTLAAQPDEIHVGGEVTHLTAEASDPDGDPLSYSWSASKGAVQGSGARTEWSTDKDDWTGPVTFTVTVTDPKGLTGTAETTVQVLERPNRPPQPVALVLTKSIYQGQSTAVRCEGRDPDGDPVTIRWQPEVGTVEPADAAEATWTLPADRAGQFSITCEATDPEGARGTATDRVLAKVRLKFPTIPFATNRLDNIAKARLDDVGALLSRDLDLRIRLIGHTDARGSEEANFKAGLKRAEKVKAYLVERHGIDPARIEVTSMGEASPIADNDTAAGRAKNRRVEIVQN